MKFTRADLIIRVKAEIERREQAVADANAKATASYEKKQAEYVANTAEGWRKLADTIRVRQRAGQPITDSDVPAALRGGWNGGHITTWSGKPPAQAVADVRDLRTLLDLLEAATDDEITTNSLERMGFRTAQLFRAR